MLKVATGRERRLGCWYGLDREEKKRVNERSTQRSRLVGRRGRRGRLGQMNRGGSLTISYCACLLDPVVVVRGAARGSLG